MVRAASSYFGLIAVLLLPSCAALSHEPGTPYGGAYCSQRGGDPEPACYPSEAERAAAWRQREAEGRRAWAAEHPAEARAAAEERARATTDFDAGQRDQAREAADLAAARVQADHDRAAARAAAAAARDAEASRLDLARQRTADPAFAVPALSALLCRQKAREAEFRSDLQREARITTISGVVNKAARSSLAAGVVDAQDRAAKLRQRLRAVGNAQPLPCAAVAPLLVCRAHEEACRADTSTRDVLDVMREIERDP
jgi:colicin import membrane protein